jgi:hypothetical protein
MAAVGQECRFPSQPTPSAVGGGEPTFAQPPGKGQAHRQRLLVAVPTESRHIGVGGRSRPEARLRRLGRALR